MPDRKKLLDTGKKAGKSIAGTLKSAAGTLSEKGKEGVGKAAKATKEGVRRQYNELTDETVTDQEKARLERARQEALEEARREARQEFQEEYKENVADEAYDMELQRLRQRNQGVTRQVESEPAPRQSRQSVGMGMFGIPQQPQASADSGESDDPRPDPVANLFGMPQQQSDSDDRPQSPFGLF